MHLLVAPGPRGAKRMRYGPDPAMFGELRVPTGAGPHPVVVFIHGGYWRARYNLSYGGYLCAALTRKGAATWNIEYRRVGNPGGGWPGTFNDVAAAIGHLAEIGPAFHLDLSRLVVVGHSAGGHLACWYASAHRLPPDSPVSVARYPEPSAVVSLAGVLDLYRAYELDLSSGAAQELLGGSPGEVPERYEAASPAQMVPSGVRSLIVHGTEDDSVPYLLGEEYYRAARQAGDQVSFLPLPDTGHFEIVDPKSAVWPRIEREILGYAGIGLPG